MLKAVLWILAPFRNQCSLKENVNEVLVSLEISLKANIVEH